MEEMVRVANEPLARAADDEVMNQHLMLAQLHIFPLFKKYLINYENIRCFSMEKEAINVDEGCGEWEELRSSAWIKLKP